ncbi:MAG TPA: GyrI-like domain-containing protein [Acidimicrobiia bacterium]|nr:GyrI-like domain-containing protein [Acidimicrobiia bacterium]HLF60407.1 GyrI-like domain-containing protein [Acidimicrobiia bacterium]
MYQVSSRTLQEQPTLVMTAKAAVAEIPGLLGKAYTAVAERAGRSGRALTGPPFARYRPLDDEYAEFEIEAGFPVDQPAEGGGEVVASTLPGGAAAVVTHVGPYDQMKPAYEAVETWIVEHDSQPEGAPWEVYYSDPVEQTDPATWRTEIVQPYKVL